MDETSDDKNTLLGLLVAGTLAVGVWVGINISNYIESLQTYKGNYNLINIFALSGPLFGEIWPINIPVIAWLAYFFMRKRKKYILEKEQAKLIERIQSNPKYSEEFNRKEELLNNLYEKGGLEHPEYEQKYNELVEEYSKALSQEDVKLSQFNEIEEKKKLKKDFDEALKEGLLTQKEYEEKIKSLTMQEGSN